jgi:hypothetical protein
MFPDVMRCFFNPWQTADAAPMQGMGMVYCDRVTFDGLMARLWASQHLAAQWFFNTMAFSQKRKL